MIDWKGKKELIWCYGFVQKLWIQKANLHFSRLLKHLILFLLCMKVSAT